MRVRDILQAAIRHYGVEHQIGKAKEEMCELIIELERRQDGRTDENKICEEIADALITVLQLALIFNWHKVLAFFDAKLRRLEERMRWRHFCREPERKPTGGNAGR